MKHTLLLFFFIATFHSFSQNKDQSVGFKENKGQIIDQKGRQNTAVKYLLNTRGLNVQLKKNGFSYDIYEVKKTPLPPSRDENVLLSRNKSNLKEKLHDYNLEYIFHRVDIDFVNSSSKVELIAEQKSNDFDNYYNIISKPEGVLGVRQYKQITYKNIYPDIDVVFSIPNDPQKTVEYNFVVHPKGKISDIQLKFNGAETDLVDNKIQMNIRFGKMEETLPASWLEEGDSKKEIAVGYRKIKKDVYGFTSSNIVSGKKVIIDPVPIRLWGTYYGGEETEYPFSVFVKDDFVYMAGITYSTNNIASSGSFQSNYASIGVSDSFFTKLNSNGTRVWGTYYGGISSDQINQIKVSVNDNIYVAGNSLSFTNISTAGTHQPVKSGVFDGFIAKFDSNGSRQWGTYYGGLYGEDLEAILIDGDENVYISGGTFSDENISTADAQQPLRGIIEDGFIAKLDKNGTRKWGTYYGGSKADEVFDSQFDSNGNIIFLGSSRSSENISTANSYQEVNMNADGFLVKFTPNGTRIWATYFGGNNDDRFFYIGTDSNGNIYAFGETNSTSNISSPGVFQESYIPKDQFDYSGCLLKFDSNGYKIWGSYFFPETLGGSVSKDGSIYFTGRAKDGFLPTPNAYQEIRNSGADSYLVKFNTNGQRVWATYFGGEVADDALITAVDNHSNIYLAGSTNSETNISTPGTYQEHLYADKSSYQLNGGDAFLVKFKDCESNTTISSNSPVCFGKTLELKASGGTTYAWTGPNGFTSTDQNPIVTNVKAINGGEYSCFISGSGDCDDTRKINVIIGDTETPVPDALTLPTITGDCHTTVNTIPTALDACAGAITGTTTDPLSYSLPGTYTIVWNYNDGNGNTSKQNQTVTITNQPLPVINTPQNFCIQENATLANITISGQNIKWYDAVTAGTLLPNATLLQNGITYFASQTINGCESERSAVTINIQNTPSPTGEQNQPFCTGQNPTITNIQITGDLIKWYDSASNGTLLASTENLQDGKTYYAAQTVNNCESERLAVTVAVGNTPAAPLELNHHDFCKNENATLNNIQISGQNLKWYSSNIAAGKLPSSTLLENNTTYYVSQTTGCESERTPVLIQINDTALPTAKTEQSFCIDENATITDIAVTGNNLLWYNTQTNGNILVQSTILQNGTYYVSQTLNNCESERLAVKIKVQDTQNPIADTPQTFCIQENASISDIKISGENIKWFESSSSNSTLSESTLLQNGITYYASQNINSCESDRIPVTIQILEATTADCINFVDELPYPKFFTPNNDGYNDSWSIDFAYLAPKSGIKIFDRYGKFIKELFNNGAWDGNYLGQQQPASDYWFTVIRLNGTEYRGHFSLKR